MRTVACIASLLSFGAFAQSGDRIVSAQIDRDSILIGEQVVLTLQVDPDGLPVTWPMIGDTLAPHIEVVGDSGLDTLQGDGTERGGRHARGASALPHLVRYGLLGAAPLAFPHWHAGPGERGLPAACAGHSTGQRSNTKDIKPIELPFSLTWWLREQWMWIAGGSAIALAFVALILLIRRFRRKVPEVEIEAPVIPLHERVLLQLEALDRERVWQQGDHKSYQSRLTDLLRGYIEERYRVPALERTTDELLHELRVSPLSMEQQSLLANLLRLADMVKFAKALPSPQENEQMMVSAVRFIRETVPTNRADAPRT
ncbi:MAG: hypothetical protein IPG92_08835 [Flavobacteriales bacterium]|nr:hypothetical protein [Flavobacteriales bacterium]